MASLQKDSYSVPPAASTTLLQTLELHKSDVNWCAFKENTLATCSADKTVRLWRFGPDGRLEEDETVSPLVGHSYYVHCCQFSPCGRILASSSTDGRVILWDVQNGESIHELSHESLSCIKICCFSPDGDRLVTGSDDETLVLWDVRSVYAGLDAGTKISGSMFVRSFIGHEATIFAACFSPDGEVIVSGCGDGELRFWDAKYGHDPALIELNDAHDLGVTVCIFSPVKSMRSDGQVRFQDPKHPSLSDDMFLLASAGNCNSVKLWHVSSFPEFEVTLLRTLSVHASSVSSVAFTADGAVLASASTDRTVALWDTREGSLLYHWECHSRYLTTCAFYRREDQLLLATGSNDKNVKIWNVNLGDDPDVNERRNDDSLASSSTSSAKIDSTPRLKGEEGCSAEKTVTTLMGPAASKPVSLPDVAKKKTKIADWSVDQVCDWLNSMLDLEEHVDRFRSNAIDGQELMNVDNQTLVDLGVSALGHRNKIIRGLQKMLAHPYLAFHGSVECQTPDEYLCPITHELMNDPVIASDGYSYERSAMEAWLRSGTVVSPMTNAPLVSPTLTPNRSLKLLIERFIL